MLTSTAKKNSFTINIRFNLLSNFYNIFFYLSRVGKNVALGRCLAFRIYQSVPNNSMSILSKEKTVTVNGQSLYIPELVT